MTTYLLSRIAFVARQPRSHHTSPSPKPHSSNGAWTSTRRPRPRVLLLCSISVVLGGSALSQTQYPSMPLSSLFDPKDPATGNHLVPLSEFKHKGEGSVTMHVDPSVLTGISTLRVARKNSSGVVLFEATAQNGAVTFSAPGSGDCVVVSPQLTQTLSVVTHWRMNMMVPRGEQSPGASDGVDMIFFDSTTGEIKSTSPSNTRATSGIYTWATDPTLPNTHNLFDDGCDTCHHEDDLYPSYEVYIGENYSVYDVDDLAAIRLSDMVRQETGFPVAHRNDFSELRGRQGTSPIAIFQIAHARIIQAPTVTADKQSLATFVLPPNWDGTVNEGAYPIMFNGFYDIHGSTFGGIGLSFMKSINSVYRNNNVHKVIGILWNGGGSFACNTTQLSALPNARRAVDDAVTELKADRGRILLTGGSRGGTTALEVASYFGYLHGLNLGYNVPYVNARDPEVLLYDLIHDHSDTTYAVATNSIPPVTGYLDAWKADWTKPEMPNMGESGRDLTLWNLFNTDSANTINSQFSIDSNLLRGWLASGGSQIVLTIGTNDSTKPVTHLVNYVDKLRVSNHVPVQCGIFYRSGHESPDGILVTDQALLENLFITPFPAITDKTQYFARCPTDPAKVVEIFPPSGYVPFALEMPLVVGGNVPISQAPMMQNQCASLSLLGTPDSYYEVKVVESTLTCLPPSFPSPCTGTCTVIASGYLTSAVAGGLFGTASPKITGGNPPLSMCSLAWQQTSGATYWVTVTFTPPGQSAVTLGLNPVANEVAPLGVPWAGPVGCGSASLLGVFATEQPGTDDNLSHTGGLAEDNRFLPQSFTCQ